jgi:hypothetical protein
MEKTRAGIRGSEFRLYLPPGHLGIQHEAVTLAGEHPQEGVLVIPIHFDPDQISVGVIWNEVLIDFRNRKRSGQILRTGSSDLLYEYIKESLQNIVRP